MDEIKLKCVLTLSNGHKEIVKVIPKDKPIFFEQLERDLIIDLNKMLVNTSNKVIKCHLMRN